MPLGTYFTGTIAIAVGAVVANGTGVTWNTMNARAGDTLIVAGHEVGINDVNSLGQLAIDAWPAAYGAIAAGTAYKIRQNSPLRFVGSQAMLDISTALTQWNSLGPIFNVPTGAVAPDPSYGADGQYAHQLATDIWWTKTLGVWVVSASPSGAASLFAGQTFFGTQIFSNTVTFNGVATHSAALIASVAVALNSVSGNTIIGPGTSGNVTADLRLNGGSGASGGYIIYFQRNSVSKFFLANSSTVVGDGFSDMLLYNAGTSQEAMRVSFADSSVSFGSTVAASSLTTAAVKVAGGLSVAGKIATTSFIGFSNPQTTLMFDGTNSGTITIPNGGSDVLAVGQGFLGVYNVTSAKSAFYHTGYGFAVLISNNPVGAPEWVASTTAPAAGKSSVAYDGVSRYRIYNNTGGTCIYRPVYGCALNNAN